MLSELAMKRLFSILAASAAILSCTEPYKTPDIAYYVDEGGTFIFKASVEPLSGSWVWDASTSKIGIYADNRENVAFVPRRNYDGVSPEAEVFGPAASGKVFAYFPYRAGGYEPAKYGCMELPLEQKYYEDAVSQIEGNTPVMVTAAEDRDYLRFRHHCGAMRLQVKINFSENLRTLTLSANEPVSGWLDLSGSGEMQNPSRSVKVIGIDKPCTEDSPAIVWIMLPEGSYSGVYITAAGETESISTIVPGEFVIEAGQECNATAQEEKNEYGGNYFEGEEVNYDN